MKTVIWCSVFVVLLLPYGIVGEPGGTSSLLDEDQRESQRSKIPRHHHSGRHKRHSKLIIAERERYSSVLAIGVGCGVAGGWICLATLVYVVRYLRAKQKADKRNAVDELL